MINFSSANMYGNSTVCKALKNTKIDELLKYSKTSKADRQYLQK